MAIANPCSFAWKVLGALVLGLLGDEFLAVRFLDDKKETMLFSIGAGLFAAGHGLYIWALLSLTQGVLLKAAVIAVAGCALSLLYNRRKGSDPGELKVPSVAYIILVVTMASVACAVAITRFNAGTLLFALGGIGFVLSDNILVAYNFGKDKRFLLDILVHITYYAAQLCIAWSIAFI